MNGTTWTHLVAQMSDLIDKYSAEQHDLARRLDALRRARTELRLGRSPAVVLAMLEEEISDSVGALVDERQTARGIFPVEARHASGQAITNGLRVSFALRG